MFSVPVLYLSISRKANIMLRAASKSLEDMQRAAKLKGRAYQCIRRCHQEGKEFIDFKKRVEEHILKYHLSLDQGFYCTLCLFRSTDRSSLFYHVFKHHRHRQIVQEKGVTDSTLYLKKSPNPYTMGKDDYFVFSADSSHKLFLRRTQQASEKTDILHQAVQEIFPQGMDDLESEIGCMPQPEDSLLQPDNLLTSILMNGLQQTLNQTLDTRHRIPIQTAPVPTVCTQNPLPPQEATVRSVTAVSGTRPCKSRQSSSSISGSFRSIRSTSVARCPTIKPTEIGLSMQTPSRPVTRIDVGTDAIIQDPTNLLVTPTPDIHSLLGETCTEGRT